MLLNGVIAVCVIVVGFGIAQYLKETAPKAQKKKSEKSATMVEVMEVKNGDNPAIIYENAKVQAKEISTLKAQVSGNIVTVTPKLTPGFFVKKGELLAKIDDEVYEYNLAKTKSAYIKAQADYQIELGEQSVVKKEYELLGRELEEKDRALALREPQLAQAKADMESAEASYKSALRDLKNTEIRAPFDGVITAKNISTGSFVSTSSELLTIVDASSFWIECEVQNENLRFIEKRGEGSKGSKVLIAFGNTQREGEVLSIIPQVSDTTQRSKILVELQDPLALRDSSLGAIELGSYVSLAIEGKKIENSLKLDWGYLRAGEKVWVLNENGELQYRTPQIVFRGNSFVILQGLNDGEKIVLTNLGAPAEGIRLVQKEGKSADKKSKE